MMMPTAMSTTLPLTANSWNSLMIPITDSLFLFLAPRYGGTHSRRSTREGRAAESLMRGGR
jgi:hypothetical protein